MPLTSDRGADGRYVTHGTSSGTLAAGSDLTQQSSPTRRPLPSSSSQYLSGGRNVATSTSPLSSGNTDRGTVAQDRNSSIVPSTQPNIIGESWYASYVMRGYRPGHASVHRRLDDNNAMVQSISEDMQKSKDADHISPGTSSRPQESPAVSTPGGASVTRGADGLHNDLPAPELIDRLIAAYFSRFHVFCPIVIRSSFLASVANGTVSLTLLCSVLVVASLHCEIETIHLLGYNSRYKANADLSARAVAAFDADKTSDRTSMFLSSFLLHYWFGSPSAYRDLHWWFAASVRSAQTMGYHLSTKHTQMAPAEKARWKRVWWCLYVRDRQISLSTGSPMVINDADHNVEELVPEDLSDEPLETVRYLIGQIGLNKIGKSTPSQLNARWD